VKMMKALPAKEKVEDTLSAVWRSSSCFVEKVMAGSGRNGRAKEPYTVAKPQ
jgi:hypothetical protein